MEFCCSLLRIAPVSARSGIKKQDRPNDIAKEGGVISENVLHDWSSDKNVFHTSEPLPPSPLLPLMPALITLQITFANKVGKFDLEVTTFQMAVMFVWNERPREKITFENLRCDQSFFLLSVFVVWYVLT